MSTISAGTTTTTALVSTGDTTGNLVLATGSVPTTALTLNSTTQAATFAGPIVTSGTVNALNTFGFENRIINGNMAIDQRNNGGILTVNSVTQKYPVDRFYCENSTSGVFTIQQSATAPAGFTNSVIATVTTGSGTLTGSQYASIAQQIEGYNIADLGFGTANAKTFTLSFWVRSSVTGTFGGTFRNSADNRCYAFTYTINAANTWEQKSITVAGDTSGTWLTTNGIGLKVWFSLGSGPTFSGTANVWGSTLITSATGATNLLATNGATFYITGVQLEVGSQATSFDFRSYGTELALCYRYFRQYSSVGNTNSSVPMIGTGSAQTGGTAIYRMGWTMDIAMRSAPSITFSSMAVWAGTNVPSVSVNTNYSGTQYVDIDLTTSGLGINSAGCVAKLYFAGTTPYVQVNSEL